MDLPPRETREPRDPRNQLRLVALFSFGRFSSESSLGMASCGMRRPCLVRILTRIGGSCTATWRTFWVGSLGKAQKLDGGGGQALCRWIQAQCDGAALQVARVRKERERDCCAPFVEGQTMLYSVLSSICGHNRRFIQRGFSTRKPGQSLHLHAVRGVACFIDVCQPLSCSLEWPCYCLLGSFVKQRSLAPRISAECARYQPNKLLLVARRMDCRLCRSVG